MRRPLEHGRDDRRPLDQGERGRTLREPRSPPRLSPSSSRRLQTQRRPPSTDQQSRTRALLPTSPCATKTAKPSSYRTFVERLSSSPSYTHTVLTRAHSQPHGSTEHSQHSGPKERACASSP